MVRPRFKKVGAAVIEDLVAGNYAGMATRLVTLVTDLRNAIYEELTQTQAGSAFRLCRYSAAEVALIAKMLEPGELIVNITATEVTTSRPRTFLHDELTASAAIES